MLTILLPAFFYMLASLHTCIIGYNMCTPMNSKWAWPHPPFCQEDINKIWNLCQSEGGEIVYFYCFNLIYLIMGMDVWSCFQNCFFYWVTFLECLQNISFYVCILIYLTIFSWVIYAVSKWLWASLYIKLCFPFFFKAFFFSVPFQKMNCCVDSVDIFMTQYILSSCFFKWQYNI